MSSDGICSVRCLVIPSVKSRKPGFFMKSPGVIGTRAASENGKKSLLFVTGLERLRSAPEVQCPGTARSSQVRLELSGYRGEANV